MIKRYRHLGRLIFIPSGFSSDTVIGDTTSTKTFSTVITGEPGSVVTFQVTTYAHTNGGANYTVDGVVKVLTDIFTRTLDGAGQVTITQFIDVGTTTPSNGINIVLTITATTIGPVSGTTNTDSISKTT